jgi:hypothetical protein
MRLALIDSGGKGRFDILKGALNTNDEVKRVRIAIVRGDRRELDRGPRVRARGGNSEQKLSGRLTGDKRNRISVRERYDLTCVSGRRFDCEPFWGVIVTVEPAVVGEKFCRTVPHF